MTQPSIWNPSQDAEVVTASYTSKAQEFVATEGQTNFSLTEFSYVVGVGAIELWVNGAYIRSFQEVSTTEIALPAGKMCVAGDVVVVRGITDEFADLNPVIVAVEAARDAAEASAVASLASETAAVVSAGEAASSALAASASETAAAASVSLAQDQVALAAAQKDLATAQAVIATQKATEVSDKAPLASPTFTGTPTAPTAAAGTSTTQLATTAFVSATITSDRPYEATATNIKINGTQAVGARNTVARGDHVHPIDTSRAPLASPTFTGVPTAPTATAGTNTTQIATTAFVTSAISAVGVTTSAVLSATAGAAVGAVGTYAFLSSATGAGSGGTPGSTYPGSSLRYTNNSGSYTGPTPAGTWRLMGSITDGSSSDQGSVWLRIS